LTAEYGTCATKKSPSSFKVAHYFSLGILNYAISSIMIRSSDNPEIFVVSQHLDEMFLNVGDTVTAETVIGTVGETGAIQGAHLHFEVIAGARTDGINIGGTPLEPWIFLP
jgi:hypothetical protein